MHTKSVRTEGVRLRACTRKACVCALRVQVSAEGGQDVGKISKQWGGYVKEAFSVADNFGVNCERYICDLDLMTVCFHPCYYHEDLQI